jgi:hypothetical protein
LGEAFSRQLFNRKPRSNDQSEHAYLSPLRIIDRIQQILAPVSVRTFRAKDQTLRSSKPGSL